MTRMMQAMEEFSLTKGEPHFRLTVGEAGLRLILRSQKTKWCLKMQEMVEHMMIVPSMTYCYSNIADTKTGTKSTATVSSALRRTGLNFSICHGR